METVGNSVLTVGGTGVKCTVPVLGMRSCRVAHDSRVGCGQSYPVVARVAGVAAQVFTLVLDVLALRGQSDHEKHIGILLLRRQGYH